LKESPTAEIYTLSLHDALPIYERPLSLVMMDIDRFKTINEEMGHLGGDFTLRELAARIKGNIRREELFARYGGEEFAVVLPETRLEEHTSELQSLTNLVCRLLL